MSKELTKQSETLCTGCGATVTQGEPVFIHSEFAWRDVTFSPFCADGAYHSVKAVALPPVAIKPETSAIKHTPGPWKYAKVSGDKDWYVFGKGSGYGGTAIVASGVLTEDDAKFIVRSENSHDELAERLTAMTAIVKAIIKDDAEGGAYHSLPGYGGRTITENLHESLVVLAKANGVQS